MTKIRLNKEITWFSWHGQLIYLIFRHCLQITFVRNHRLVQKVTWITSSVHCCLSYPTSPLFATVRLTVLMIFSMPPTQTFLHYKPIQQHRSCEIRSVCSRLHHLIIPIHVNSQQICLSISSHFIQSQVSGNLFGKRLKGQISIWTGRTDIWKNTHHHYPFSQALTHQTKHEKKLHLQGKTDERLRIASCIQLLKHTTTLQPAASQCPIYSTNATWEITSQKSEVLQKEEHFKFSCCCLCTEYKMRTYLLKGWRALFYFALNWCCQENKTYGEK